MRWVLSLGKGNEMGNEMESFFPYESVSSRSRSRSRALSNAVGVVGSF